MIEALTTLLGAILALIVGMVIFFNQRQYELIISRYLENGIDKVASEIENNYQITAHNWSRSVDITKQYRDLGEKLEGDSLKSGFLPYEAGRFQHVANFRLYRITGYKRFFQLFQLALVDFDKANSKFCSEYPASILAALSSDNLTKSHREIAVKMMEESQRYWQNCDRWSTLIAEVHSLSDFLESKRLSFEDLDSLKDTKEVKKFVERVESKYGELLPTEEAQKDI